MKKYQSALPWSVGAVITILGSVVRTLSVVLGGRHG